MKALSSKKSFSKRRKIFIIVAVLALIGVGASVYYFTGPYKDAQEKQKALDKDRNAAKTNGNAKTDVINGGKNSNGSSNGLPENSTSTTSDQAKTNSALSVNITSTSQTNGMVNASAQTNGSGYCIFLYSVGNKDKPVSRQVSVSNNTCSISISQNEFTYVGGPWELTVTYYNGNSKAEATQSVTIK